MLTFGGSTSAAYDKLAAVSIATRDAAAAAEICFVHEPYATRGATLFAQCNAHQVMSLGDFIPPDFDSIRIYTRLKDLDLKLDGQRGDVLALLPRSLTKLVISLQDGRLDWTVFRPLCCLQELRVNIWYNRSGFGIQLR